MPLPLQTANNLPSTFNPAQALSLPNESSMAKADIKVLYNFVKAAQDVVEVPNYRAIQFIYEHKRHCVRCHAWYMEKNNHRRACIGVDSEGRCVNVCSPVGLSPQSRNKDRRHLDGLGRGYEGYHTDGVEVEGDDFNSIRIRRCKINEEGDCTREWVENGPAFDYPFGSFE